MATELEAIRDLTNDGHTAMQIGARLGISIGHVYKLRAAVRREFGADSLTGRPDRAANQAGVVRSLCARCGMPRVARAADPPPVLCRDCQSVLNEEEKQIWAA